MSFRVSLDGKLEHAHAPFYAMNQLGLLYSPDGSEMTLVHPTAAQTPLGLLDEGAVDIAVTTLAEVFIANARGQSVAAVGRVSAGLAGVVVRHDAATSSPCCTVGRSFGVRRWVDRALLRAIIKDIWIGGICDPPWGPIELRPIDRDVAQALNDEDVVQACLVDTTPVLASLNLLIPGPRVFGVASAGSPPLGDRVLAIRLAPGGTLTPGLGTWVAAVHSGLRHMAERCLESPSNYYAAWKAASGESSMHPAQEKVILDAALRSIPWDPCVSHLYLGAIANWLQTRGLPCPADPAVAWIDPFDDVLRT